MFSTEAARKVILLPGINSILDVGSGKGEHAHMFATYNKQVYCVDIYDSKANAYDHHRVKFVLSDFLSLEQTFKVDCVWCSHILEHQPNVNIFLKKCLTFLNPGGYLVITVPPAKNDIVGGHLTMWNAGLVMYNLILAGTSCRNVMIRQYGYNLSVIVHYRPITLPDLKYDKGDIETLSQYFPERYGYQGFNGLIKSYQWT